MIAVSPDDFTELSTSLEFPAGSPEGTTRCLNITINEDTLIEGNETFSVMLTLISTELGVTMGNSITTVTILDNEGKFGKKIWLQPGFTIQVTIVIKSTT